MGQRFVYLGALDDMADTAKDAAVAAFDPLPKRRPKIVFEDPDDPGSDDRKGILLRLRVDTSPAAKDTADRAVETARFAVESFRWGPILAAGAAGMVLGVLLTVLWQQGVAAAAKRRHA